MSDLLTRIENSTGRITLNRPDALNALTYDMVLGIEAALDAWRDTVDQVIVDATGDRAFCSGGDIADMYASGQRGDLTYGRRFWRDEYRLNAKIFEYPKPIISFLQGFTMGGGVGVGCHGTHRVVGESSQIAMPECAIGLVPDVGGSLMLALNEGHVGEYLGTTGMRMNAADAITAGFADGFVPEAEWEALKAAIVVDGVGGIAYCDAGMGKIPVLRAEIDRHFAGATLADIERSLRSEETEFTAATLKALGRNAPLAMGCCVQIVRRLRSAGNIRQALDQEYRFTHRAVAQGDFIEGIRAAIIDKDRKPVWKYGSITDLPQAEVTRMLMPLGEDALVWED